MEIDVVDLLHLMLQHFGLHDGIEQNLIRALDSRQHVETLHQVWHTHIVMALRLRFAGFQEFLMQQPVGMLRVEDNVIAVVGIGVNPNGIFAALEHTTEDGR